MIDFSGKIQSRNTGKNKTNVSLYSTGIEKNAQRHCNMGEVSTEWSPLSGFKLSSFRACKTKEKWLWGNIFSQCCIMIMQSGNIFQPSI